MFLRRLVPWPSIDIRVKFHGDRTGGGGLRRGGGLNARGIAKYSNFGHFEGYISETVQDMM